MVKFWLTRRNSGDSSELLCSHDHAVTMKCSLNEQQHQKLLQCKIYVASSIDQMEDVIKSVIYMHNILCVSNTLSVMHLWLQVIDLEQKINQFTKMVSSKIMSKPERHGDHLLPEF